MVSSQAQKRLTKEYRSILANPPQYIVAKPNENNILEWHYVITGPPKTPYEDGQYHGILRFPKEYPFQPPSILMITPLGRFQCNTRLCLLMSDYHPDTWNPAWSVLTILVGLLSFMTGDESTMGSIATSEAAKTLLAKSSRNWNYTENARFRNQFPDLYQENIAYVKQKKIEEEAAAAAKAADVKSAQTTGTINLDELDPEDRIRIMLEKSGIKGYSGYTENTHNNNKINYKNTNEKENGQLQEGNNGKFVLLQRFSALGLLIALVAVFANYIKS